MAATADNLFLQWRLLAFSIDIFFGVLSECLWEPSQLKINSNGCHGNHQTLGVRIHLNIAECQLLSTSWTLLVSDISYLMNHVYTSGEVYWHVYFEGQGNDL